MASFKDALKAMRRCRVGSDWLVAMGGGGILATYVLHWGHLRQGKAESSYVFPEMKVGTFDLSGCRCWPTLSGVFAPQERPAGSAAQNKVYALDLQKRRLTTAGNMIGDAFQRFGEYAWAGALYPLVRARRLSLKSDLLAVHCADLREFWAPPDDAPLTDSGFSRERTLREVRRIPPSVVLPATQPHGGTAERKSGSDTQGAVVQPTPCSREKTSSLKAVPAPNATTLKCPVEKEPVDEGSQGDIAYPYEAGAGLTVRVFDKQRRSTWQVFCGLLSIGFYGSIWVLMVLGPCLVACWLFREVRYRVSNYGSGCGTCTTDVHLFANFITNGITAVLGDCPKAMAAFLKSQMIMEPNAREQLVREALLDLDQCYKKLHNSFVDWIAHTSYMGHFCITYLGLLSFREMSQMINFSSSRLNRFPAIPQTNEEALMSSLSWPEKCLMRMFQPFHNWFHPGSAIIFEDYCQFLTSGRRQEPPPLLCVHPHGVICYSTLMLSMLPEMRGFQLLVAPAVRTLTPMLNFYPIGNITLECASWKHMNMAMKNRTPLILYPGGIQEAILTEFGKEKVYLSKRRGFIQLALQHGYRVFPVYGFGENLTYKQKIQGATQWRLFLAKRGLPVVWPAGIGGIPILLPNRYPQLIVVGKGIDFPKIDNPTLQDIATYHDIFLQHIRRLYMTYGDKYFEFCQRAYGLQVPPPISSLSGVDDLPTAAGLCKHMPALEVV